MILDAGLFIIILILLRSHYINIFKIAYYKQRLINNGIDASKVDKIGLVEILKL